MKSRTIEKGKWLLQLSDNECAFDILIHYGEKELFWYRIGRIGGYFKLLIFGKKLIGWRTKKRAG